MYAKTEADWAEVQALVGASGMAADADDLSKARILSVARSRVEWHANNAAPFCEAVLARAS